MILQAPKSSVKASESYKRTFKTITVPYVSVPSKSTVLILSDPDSPAAFRPTLSCALGTERARERNRGRETETGWHFESIIKWERRFQRQRSVEGTPRGPRGPWQTSCAWSPRSQTGEDSRFLFPPQAGSQSVSSWVPAPLSVFSQIFSPFSPNSSHISRLHTCKHTYTHIPCS